MHLKNEKQLRSSDRIDRHKTTVVATVDKLHASANLGEQGVVLAATNIQAGLQRCAALANDNGAACNQLARKTLHAKSLRIGIAAVRRRTATFFMCHYTASCAARRSRRCSRKMVLLRISLEAFAVHQNLVDLHFNKVLAVALQLLVLLLALEMED